MYFNQTISIEKILILNQILTGFILYLLTIWTILGNIFILIAISTNKHLKQNGTSNILIGNLAFSDLLLGLTVLPFSATFDTFKIWPFGQLICDIWLSIDVLCCTASIWGLLMIALDRYIATNHPIKYRLQKKNIKFAIAYISLSWLISILISLGPLIFYNSEFENSYQKINGTNDYTCVLFHKPSFVVLSSIGSFYLPLLIMIILYSKVFIKIKLQNNFRNSKQKQQKASLCKQLDPRELAESTPLDDSLKLDKPTQITLSRSQNELIKNSLNNGVLLLKKKLNENFFERISIMEEIKLSENRTTKILLVIMVSFVSCWLPFFVIYIVRAYLDDPDQMPAWFMTSLIWLGYFNSCLDPILYLILNKNFRKTFFQLIKFGKVIY